MFPSEITRLRCRVGLAVGETVFWLYVGSVDGVGDAGAVDSVAVEPPVTGEPGSAGPPEGDTPVRDEAAELSAPEEQVASKIR